MASPLLTPNTIRRKRNLKGLQLSTSPIVPALKANDADLLASPLMLGLEYMLDLRPEDLRFLRSLGHGSSGHVDQVLHTPTQTIMARKNIHVDTQPQVKRQILRELKIMHDCNSPHIVSFYGAFMNQGDICFCMEFMNIGSLDFVYHKTGAIPEPIIAKITTNVLSGLDYLYETHHIIHRDIKPSNILLNEQGLIKLCDFGVSGVLNNSIANTFVGTNSYMSPERIQGGEYTVKSDVWSLGITLIELALAEFPMSPEGGNAGILDLLQFIVNEPAPTLPADRFSAHFQTFCASCLEKDPLLRPTPIQLLSLPFILQNEHSKLDMKSWAQSIQEALKTIN